MNNYCVYKHTNIINGKVYIGITRQTVQNRWRVGGKGYIGQNFYKAIKKYGWDNFKHEIVKQDLSCDEAEQLEKSLIIQYKANEREYGYNIDIGGGAIREISIETRAKMSKARLGKTPWNKGLPCPAEIRQRVSEANKGKKYTLGYHHTEEARRKMREKSANARAIYSIDKAGNKTVYNSMVEAAQSTGIDKTVISHICRGKQKQSKGYIFCYVE